MSEIDDGTTGVPESQRILTLNDTWHLADKGFLSNIEWRETVFSIRDDASWQRWAMQIVFALGVAHFLAGVIFFFAYNWADLAKDMKFSLLFGGLLAGFALWWIAGPDSRIGKAGGISATVMTGVLMAVFGQIYQTGADAHDLFIAWALLVLPWAIVSKSPVHLLIWAVIVNTALFLFSDQVMAPVWSIDWTYLAILQSGLNGLLLVVLILASRTRPYLSSQWLVGILSLGVLVPITIAGWDVASGFAYKSFSIESDGPKLLVVLAIQVALLWAFQRKAGYIFASVMALAALISTLTVLILTLIERSVDFSDAFSLLLMAIVVAGSTGIFIKQARRLTVSMRRRAEL